MPITRLSQGALLILTVGSVHGGQCAEHEVFPSRTPPTCLREQVVVNDTFKVALNSAPTSGYGWQLIQLPPSLKLNNTDYTPARHCPPGITGCRGVQTFVFDVVTPGAGTLQWSYGTMWATASTVAHCIDIIALPSPTHP